MFSRTTLKNLEDYFIPCSLRENNKGVYFCRLASYSSLIHAFICNYIKQTGVSGVCISPKIGNPLENQLNYYEEIMGLNYQLNVTFFEKSLEKWLPRVNSISIKDMAACFYETLNEMARKGKNENMQKNAYIKFMCWLYYKFEPMLHKLGTDMLPKILYEGDLSEYELKMLSILSNVGCDILVLEYNGDSKYAQIDSQNKYSQLLNLGSERFPDGYSIVELRKQVFSIKPEPKKAEVKTEKQINTNTWISGNIFEDVLVNQVSRGNDSRFCYNVFAGIYGTDEPAEYYSELLKWKLKADDMGKNIILVENGIEPPTFDEINAVQRKNYTSKTSLINDMSLQISLKDKTMEAYCRKSFVENMPNDDNLTIQRLINVAVTMVCCLKRYGDMISAKKDKETIVVYYGTVKNASDALLLKLLSKLPADVIIINPEAEEKFEIDDKLFFAKKYQQRVKKEKFPKDINSVQFGTVAFQAERQLDNELYRDTGLYRDRQFKQAMAVTLKITYEEIAILWKEEAKYRTAFETFSDKVMVPVIFSKVCGVKDEKIDEYWNGIRNLITDNTYIIKSFPYLGKEDNPFKEKAYSFITGGKISFAKIKNSTSYPLAILREDTQNYMLEKLQLLIDSNIISGTGKNGSENLILATVLNMDKKILRLIQNYDFTKDIPKIVAIHLTDTVCSQEDSILLAYLNLIGFDIVIFVPTGYNSVERFYTKEIFSVHQIGEYKYDLQLPGFLTGKRKKESFAEKIFRRGR